MNVVVWGQVKIENSSLPVAVRDSKTRVLKLPIHWRVPLKTEFNLALNYYYLELLNYLLCQAATDTFGLQLYIWWFICYWLNILAYFLTNQSWNMPWFFKQSLKVESKPSLDLAFAIFLARVRVFASISFCKSKCCVHHRAYFHAKWRLLFM